MSYVVTKCSFNYTKTLKSMCDHVLCIDGVITEVVISRSGCVRGPVRPCYTGQCSKN